MIPVLTIAQMREIDGKTISGNLTTGYSFMLKAGMGLFAAAKRMLPDRESGEVAIVCGKGKNGGDGYVVGRMLLDAGYRVMCFSLCDQEALQDEARIAYNEYIARKGNSLVFSDAGDFSGLSNYKLIIDAMLGTGLKGNPHGLWATAIDEINASNVPVLAVDTPSGLNTDTGIPCSPCVKATVTVTMGFPKIGLYFYPGKSCVGNLVIQDLTYPDEIVNSARTTIFVPTVERLREFLPPRRPAGSKFEHGLALLLCGSRGMTGSASMAANAAMRAGCGMTHLAIPESAIPSIASKVTETVLHPVRETDQGTPSLAALDRIKELAKDMQALCVGPGISHDDQTAQLVREIIGTIHVPTVLDADGINAYKGAVEKLKGHSADLVITPHKGEWERLFGSIPSNPVELCSLLSSIAQGFHMSILYKGNPSIAADSEGNVFILPFGNSSLAKAGSGDVLSGIIVSLIAQGASVTHAAVLGSYIMGTTAELLSSEYGEYSVLPTDVINSMYRSIKNLQ